MKASLQVKNGKYYAVLSYKDEFGQDKRKWIATGYEEKGNKRKAEQKLSEILQKYKDNENVIETHAKPTNDISLNEYLNQWYQSRKNEVEELTFESYGFVIKKMTKYFAKNQITLNELKPYDIQTYYNTLYKEGKTGNTVMHYHVVLREALQNAIKLGLISKMLRILLTALKKKSFTQIFTTKMN